jgi:cytochrome c biogenesis protein CcdA
MMRLKDRSLSFVVNFLLGVSWASVFIGGITSFLSFYQDSFLLAFVSIFIGAIPGMVAIILLELVITNKENQLELKKQTALLEKLLCQKNS